MAALLHDSLEDAPGSTVDTVEEMEEFIRGSIQSPEAGRTVVDAVKALTHEKNAPYSGYVLGLLDNELALRVKLADMIHNLSSSPTPRQKQKYSTALDALSDAAGGIPAGISNKHWDQLMSLTESKSRNSIRLLIRETLLF
jgi:(p)ppGpp synthase/HD superfamily hydrolase